MATITSGTTTLNMQNNRYGITSETTLTDEVRATPAPTTTTITNSIENGSILLVYTGVFNPDQFDPTFQDNTAGITAITGYQEYAATDTNNDNGLRITGWTSESFDSLSSPNFDTLYGGDDSISASSGNDIIFGFGGADTLLGNDGDDSVYGGRHISGFGLDAQHDSTDGGNNTLFGGKGNDYVLGGTGTDVIYGGRAQADTEDGNDLIEGYLGADTLFGNSGNDTIYGDRMAVDGGFNDADLIYGGLGNDQIFGQSGDDILSGGGGLAHPQDQADTISGGEGNDTIVGNGGNDSIDGDNGNDSIFGGLDNDVINGGAGNDMLSGQTGNDVLTGGAGNDIYHFAALDGIDTIEGFDAGADGTTVDTIQFDPTLGVSSFAELQSKTAVIEGNTIFSFDDGTTILLNGTTGIGEEDVSFATTAVFFGDVLALGF